MRFINSILTTLLTSFQEHNGKGSGKRLSLFVMVSLVVYTVIRYTDNDNLTTVISELGLLIVALAGVSAHYKNQRIEKEQTNEKE